MKSLRLILPAAVMLALLAGCNTPDSRIKKNPALFASFPAEIQEKVRAGKVDLGFSRDMVSMALGKPQRVYTRRTATGQIEVWAYSGYETHMDRQRVDGHVRVRDAGGAYRTVYDSFWVDVEQRVEYDRLRVEFTGDAVSAVENVTR